MKQLAYGSGFLLIAIIVAGGFYWKYFRPAETCFDEKLNQDEEQVDCGGVCVDCEIKGRELDVSSVDFLPAGNGQISFITKVENTSGNYNANFDYQFEIFGSFGGRLKSIEGSSHVASRGVRNVVIPAVSVNPEDVREITFNILELDWVNKVDAPVYNISTGEVETVVMGDEIKVVGSLANEGSLPFEKILLTALLFDNDGVLINASTAELAEIGAFEDIDFTIFFPEVDGIVEKLDTTKTDLFWEVLD